MIKSDTIQFLEDLSRHNNRDWFNEHKDRYLETHQHFKSFTNNVRAALSEFDKIEKTKIYRIYRDLRFTKDKTPYKTYYAAHFTRKGKYRRGGFYLEISPKGAWIGGGFWNPKREDLQYIREGIVADAAILREVLESEEVISRFGGLTGEELKTAPRGFDKEHPDIDLLRKKQFLLHRSYPVAEVLKEKFYVAAAEDFAAMIPVFQILTEFLIYDGNGEEREG